MAALTNALQALSARAKQTITRRQANAVADLHKAVRDALANQAAELKQPGPQIDPNALGRDVPVWFYCGSISMMVDTVSLLEPEVGELELPAQVVAILFEDVCFLK